MKYQSLDDLIGHTCDRIAYLDNYRKSPCEQLLVQMYDSVKQDFENNLDLLMLTSDYKLEKKQLKFMLRKTKKYRKQSWKLTCQQIADDYHDNKFDMFNFGYENINNISKKYELFDETNENMKLSFLERLFGSKKKNVAHKKKVNVGSIDLETGVLLDNTENAEK